MKYDDFKNSLDFVKPDAHLQTRLKAKVEGAQNKTKKSKKPVILGLVSVMALAVVVTGLGVNDLIGTDKVITSDHSVSAPTQSDSATCKVALLFVNIVYANDKKISEKPLPLDVETPLNYTIKAVDIRNKSDEEIDRLREQLNESDSQISADGVLSFRYNTEYLDNVIVQEKSFNSFSLNIKNPKNVEQIILQTNTKYWCLCYTDFRDNVDLQDKFPRGQKLTLDGKTFTEILKASSEKGYDNFNVELNHSDSLCSAINDNPDIDYKAFNDTLKFTVFYKDGSLEQSIINISLDDRGKLYAKPIS